jgi:hypothetical protein
MGLMQQGMYCWKVLVVLGQGGVASTVPGRGGRLMSIAETVGSSVKSQDGCRQRECYIM